MFHFLVLPLAVTSFSKEAVKVAYRSAGCCPLGANYDPCSIVYVTGYTASGFTCDQAKEMHCSTSGDIVSPTCGHLCGVHSSGPCPETVPTVDHVGSYTVDPITGDYQNSSFLTSLSGLPLTEVDAKLRKSILHPSSLRYALLNLPDGSNLVQFLYLPPTYTSNTMWTYVRSATDDGDPDADLRTYQTLELVGSPPSEILSAFQTKHGVDVSGWDVFKYTGDYNIEYHAATNRIDSYQVLAKLPDTTAYVKFEEFGVKVTRYDTMQELLSSIASGPPIVDLDDLVATLTAPGGVFESSAANPSKLYFLLTAFVFDPSPRTSRTLNVFNIPNDLSTLNSATNSIHYQYWFDPETGVTKNEFLLEGSNQRYTTNKEDVCIHFKAVMLLVTQGALNVDTLLDSGKAVYSQVTSGDGGRVYITLFILIDDANPIVINVAYYPVSSGVGPLATFPPTGWIQDSDFTAPVRDAAAAYWATPTDAAAAAILATPGNSVVSGAGQGSSQYFTNALSFNLASSNPTGLAEWTSYLSIHGNGMLPLAYEGMYKSLDDMRAAFQSVPNPENLFDISTSRPSSPSVDLDDLVTTLTAPDGFLDGAETVLYFLAVSPFDADPLHSRGLTIFNIPSDLSTLDPTAFTYIHYFNPSTGLPVASGTDVISYTDVRHTTDASDISSIVKLQLKAMGVDVDAILSPRLGLGFVTQNGSPGRDYVFVFDISGKKLYQVVYDKGNQLSALGSENQRFIQDSDFKTTTSPPTGLAGFPNYFTPVATFMGNGASWNSYWTTYGIDRPSPLGAGSTFKSPTDSYGRLFSTLAELRMSFVAEAVPENIFDVSAAITLVVTHTLKTGEIPEDAIAVYGAMSEATPGMTFAATGNLFTTTSTLPISSVEQIRAGWIASIRAGMTSIGDGIALDNPYVAGGVDLWNSDLTWTVYSDDPVATEALYNDPDSFPTRAQFSDALGPIVGPIFSGTYVNILNMPDANGNPTRDGGAIFDGMSMKAFAETIMAATFRFL